MATISTDVPSPFTGNVFGRKRPANEWDAAQSQKRRRGLGGASSSAAAFGCSTENSNKRLAHVLGDHGARGGKRTRCEDENDIPRYTQRQIQFIEHQKSVELQKLRQDFQAFIQKKEAENHALAAEKGKFCERMVAQQKEIDRVLAENNILKKAVAIQQKKVEGSTAENTALKHGLHQAAEHIKRLEQSNYALQVHLQQQQPNIGFGNTGPPPDVF